ncbi:hypothetical protein MMC21_001722 [Puttea exsequens]|nr:hypothetical protein [Puttea exsequens]
MFLCSWSLLCLNVPPQGERNLYRWRRKFWMTCLTLLAPEWIFQTAVGQWIHARRSIKNYHEAGYLWWTEKHGFFANMGGFMLQARDKAQVGEPEPKYWTTFPLNADQLLYLMKHNYVKPLQIDKKLIREKDKVDGAIRILTLLQISWFLINVVGRAAQHLTITCLELTTAFFIFCAFGISFCWAHKPADLVLPEIIITEYFIQDILDNAGDQARGPYLRTPLDFVDHKEWALSLYFQHCVSILRHMRIPIGRPVVPIPAIENTHDLPVSDTVTTTIFWFSMVYVVLFFSAWNFTFPSHMEAILWRAAIVTTVLTLPAFWFSTRWAFSWYPRLKERFNLQFSDPMQLRTAPRCRHWPGHGRLARRARSVLACCKNNSISKHEKLDIPLKAIFPMYILGFLYCTARAYIYAADLCELRSLPPNTYDSVNWADLVPHL